MLIHLVMVTSRVAWLAVLGVTSVTAAAGGGFLALRINHAERAVATVGAPNAPTPAPDTAAVLPASSPTTDLPPRSTKPATLIEPKRQPAATRKSAEPPAVVLDTVQPIAPPPPPAIDPSPAVAAAAIPVVDVAAADPRFREVMIPADAVIGIRLESALTSATARVEDRVSAVVERDVTVGEWTVIPAGSRLDGIVRDVRPAGKFGGQPRLAVRFTSLLLGDRERIALDTETIIREGESQTSGAVAKVGAGTVIGGIIGAFIGGKKGAAIGAGAGAAGSTAAVAAGAAHDVTLAAGTPLTVRLTAPVSVLIERR